MDTPDYGSEHMAACPYNPLHQVKRSRLQAHILKCQKQFPHYAICPYNATHRYPECETKEHFEKCPNKPTNIPEPDEPILPDNLEKSIIYSISYNNSSIYPESAVKSSVPTSLEKSSSYLESLESGVLRKPIAMRPFRRPLRETDPNHECWDD